MSLNNITQTTPAPSISERAMLVRISVSLWGATKKDDEISQEIANSHGAVSAEVGDYIKKLINKKKCPELAELYTLRSRLKAVADSYTLPWSDKGFRILSSEGYFAFTQKVAQIRNDFDAAADAFIAAYPDIHAAAKRDLNGLYKEDDWPTVPELKRKFQVSTRILPLADPNDFRVSLGATEEAAIRKQIEADVSVTVQKALLVVFEQVKVMVEEFIAKVGSYETDMNGKVIKTFKDTAVTNLLDLLDRVPLLNIARDPRLDKLCDVIRKLLCGRPAEDLRSDHVVRKAVVEDAVKVAEVTGNLIEELFGDMEVD